MARMINSTVERTSREIVINKTLKNTYMLLAMTLLFSGLTAGVSMMMNLPHPGIIVTLVGYFGLLFLTSKFSNSGLGIVFVFLLTGFMGLTLGPVINAYVQSFGNGSQIVMTAMGGTGIIFLALSAYVVVTQKDFSFIGGMLMAGILVAFIAGLAAFIFQMPMLSLAVSAMFIMLMSGLILFETSQIIHGGQTNYVMATVSLYISIYNIFTGLLHILGIFGDE